MKNDIILQRVIKNKPMKNFFKAQLRLKSDAHPHNQLILHVPHLSKLKVPAVLCLKFQNIIQSQYGENTER